MNNYGIEYAHIYTDQSFGNEQIRGINELNNLEKRLREKELSTSRLILIDDYSPAVSFNRFDFDSFFKNLKKLNALPDVVVMESEIAKCCEITLGLISDNRLKRQLEKYVESRKKYPCSLLIASWYLLRLGAFGQDSMKVVYGNSLKIFSDRIITILPDSFQTPENNASEIIKSTKFKDLDSKIERIFFYYVRPKYSDWDQFDPYEYVERNYGKDILIEDQKIIDITIKRLKELKIAKQNFQTVADVGTGPNIYPAMLISPYIRNNGVIELLDISKPNLEYLKNVINSSEEKDNWIKFETFIQAKGGSIYQDIFNRTINLAKIKKESINDLSKGKYDAVMCFFVAEGIHFEREKFIGAIHVLTSSVKRGGLLITAHMLGSKGYYAGERTSFPSVNLTVADLETEFAGLQDLTIDLIGHDNQKPVRLGYRGMALVIGRKS
jgi:hypothetical protein